jgi:hypothetical protein
MEASMFYFKRGIKLSYKRQGYIYFISQNYDLLSKDGQKKIRELCDICGKYNAIALFEFMTTDATATEICMRYFISSRTTLYRAVKRYYECFPFCLQLQL